MRNNILRFVMFYLVWAVVVVGVFLYTLNTGIQSVNKAPFGADLSGSFATPFIVMFGGLGLPWILFWVLMSRKPGWNKQVLMNGKQAPATVLSVSDTGVRYGNMDFVVKLQLQVQPADEPVFQTWLETTVSKVDIPRPGDVYVVKYDPNNKDHILLVSQSDIAAGYGTMPTAATPSMSYQTSNFAGNPNQLVQQLMNAAAQSGASVSVQDLRGLKANGGKDIATELANLAQLHKSGDLSDTEYDAAKKKLLG